MHVELVRTRTADGLRLDGMFQVAQPVTEPTCLDAILCVHGVGGNFYSSSLFDELGQRMLQAGVAVLRVNTRGHDGVSTAVSDQGGRLLGAAFERVSDCRWDIRAWLDWLVARGYARVGLMGHSLGALKSLYAQAFDPHPATRRLIAISPPRLSYARFREMADQGNFLHSLATAERLIAEGNPDMLFRSTFPFPLVLSAATFLDKYGPGERYNLLTVATELRIPWDLIFGEQELVQGGAAFLGLQDEVRLTNWPHQTPRVTVVPRANHFYAGCLADLAEVVAESIRRPVDGGASDVEGD